MVFPLFLETPIFVEANNTNLILKDFPYNNALSLSWGVGVTISVFIVNNQRKDTFNGKDGGFSLFHPLDSHWFMKLPRKHTETTRKQRETARKALRIRETATRMSQELSKCVVNGYNLLVKGVYWGYNPLIRSPLIRSLPTSGTSKQMIFFLFRLHVPGIVFV